MPFDKTALAKLGSTQPHKGEFRAHLYLRSDTGTQMNIRGPCRPAVEEAEKDLRQIRAAGAVGSTREESLKIMEAEARRIKMSAEYQSQIQQTIERMASREIVDESDVEYDDDDMSVESDPPWMKEYPSEEEDSPKESQQSTRPMLTPLEATAELTKFRPIISKLSDLQHLLECNADPNMPKLGDISPLRKVMSFAAERYVAEMRDVLLQYGANEREGSRQIGFTPTC